MSTVVASARSTPASWARSTRARVSSSDRVNLAAISSVISIVPASGPSAPALNSMAAVT